MSEFTVEAINRKDGARATVALKLLGSDPSRPYRFRLQASQNERSWTEAGGDYFEALQHVRRKLEAGGWLLVCYGGSRNVYPSGMSRDMGMGLTGYRLQIGHQGRQEDRVGIFDTGPDVEPATVEEQDTFHKAWIESLKRGQH